MSTPSPLAILVLELQRAAPAYRLQMLLGAITSTPGSRMAFPGDRPEQRGWIIHLHGVTGTGPTSTAAMADWLAGALQAAAWQTTALDTPPAFANHADEIATLLREHRR